MDVLLWAVPHYSHDFEHKAGNYETWTGMNKNPDWTRYEH